MNPKRLVALALVCLLSLTGSAGARTASAAAPSQAAPCVSVAGAPTHVLWWILENHSYDQARGHMPYLDAKADACAILTDDWAITHPSLPNYIALSGGSTYGVDGDGSPAKYPVDGASVYEQLGGDWAAFMQSMPENCRLHNARPYVVRHNPPAYFTSIRSACDAQDVPYSELQARLDAGSLPTLSVVVPDLCHDGHKNSCPGGDTSDGQAQQADDYLASELPSIIASPQYRSGSLLVVVTFDEGHGDNHVYTVLLGATIRPGTAIDTHLTHYSLLAYVEQLAGVPCLNEACSAPPLTGAGL
jgi:phosphatidylinositol-3-phosphatase